MVIGPEFEVVGARVDPLSGVIFSSASLAH